MVKKVDKTWGYEEWIVNKQYCGKKLVVKKGMMCSLHFHLKKDETFYVNKGKVGMMTVQDGEIKYEVLDEGAIIHIPPGLVHSFGGVTDAEIIEFSTHHEDDDSYRIIKSGEMLERLETFFKANPGKP